MRGRGVSTLVIESPKPRTCHPEREGGGWGGREGSPHKSWCRSTVIAEILRSPRTHPPLPQDDTNLDLSIAPVVSSLRFSARAVKGLGMTQTFVAAIFLPHRVNFTLSVHLLLGSLPRRCCSGRRVRSRAA